MESSVDAFVDEVQMGVVVVETLEAVIESSVGKVGGWV